ncbi:AraC family transcriptional regulator [Pseudomonas syringae]|uniref:AraC family transcriptional regulator n=1 Tax=Pseudomonas syringae TaxID=317 RepID=UPI002180092D|nr:AraC family transcriptional regulator [Pseudomonas syringae]
MHRQGRKVSCRFWCLRSWSTQKDAGRAQVTDSVEIKTEPLDRLELAHTIVIPGCEDPFVEVPETVRIALREAYVRGARLASICTGAFILAESGLLDGKRATTHWRFAEDLAKLHPEIQVEPNVLFVDEGSIVTSAGASAGLDMCLHLVRRDYGQSVAANTARLAATLNAERFYQHCGFTGSAHAVYISPSGLRLACVPMRKQL